MGEGEASELSENPDGKVIQSCTPKWLQQILNNFAFSIALVLVFTMNCTPYRNVSNYLIGP